MTNEYRNPKIQTPKPNERSGFRNWTLGFGNSFVIWDLSFGASRPQAGHTLLELVVGLGLFIAVSTIVTYASIDGWQALVTNRARASLVTELDEAAVRIDAFVRKATALPDQATVAGLRYQQSATTLVLTVPAVDGTGQPLAGVSDTVVYTIRAEGLVELIEPGGGSRVGSDRLVVPAAASASFALTTQTKPLVTATLSATRPTGRTPLSRTVTVTTLTRNAEE